MEQLLKDQKSDLEELQRLKVNHKKRNKTSQTETYLNDKLTELNALFDDIAERNRE